MLTPGKVRYTWLKESRGGYGYIEPIAAILINATAKRARIAVYHLRTKELQFKTVKVDHLEVRETKTLVLDEMYKDAIAQETTNA